MNLDHLRYFVEAARRQHVGRAARALGISPSAVSHAIAGLERTLGCPLFVKRGKHVVLTRQGASLLERGGALLSDVRALVDHLSTPSGDVPGRLRVAAAHALAIDYVAVAWTELQREHPRVVGELYARRSAEVLSAVSTGELDLGVCFSPQRTPGVSSRVLHEGALVVAVREAHPLASRRRVAAEADRSSLGESLSRFPAVLPRGYQGIDPCDEHPAFRDHRVVARVGTLVDNYDVMAAVVRGSDGWCFLPDILSPPGLVVLEATRAWGAGYRVEGVWRAAGEAPLFQALLDRVSHALAARTPARARRRRS
jgi:DNA-binding transcriptional LysR family regulator